MNARAAVTLGIAFLLLAIPLAGCVGSSPGSASDGASDTTDDEAQTGPPPSDRTEDRNETEPSGNETGGADDGETNETRRETFTNQTNVPAKAAAVFYEVPDDATGEETTWDLLGNAPDEFSAILVEVTWQTVTEGTPVGSTEAEVNSGAGALQNRSSGTSGPLRIWITPDDYTRGELILRVAPVGPVGIWVDIDITVHTTLFFGGTPDWSYSAL